MNLGAQPFFFAALFFHILFASCDLHQKSSLYCRTENIEKCIKIETQLNRCSCPVLILGTFRHGKFRERKYINLRQISEKSYQTAKSYADYYKCFSLQEDQLSEFNCSGDLKTMIFVKGWKKTGMMKPGEFWIGWKG